MARPRPDLPEQLGRAERRRRRDGITRDGIAGVGGGAHAGVLLNRSNNELSVPNGGPLIIGGWEPAAFNSGIVNDFPRPYDTGGFWTEGDNFIEAPAAGLYVASANVGFQSSHTAVSFGAELRLLFFDPGDGFPIQVTSDVRANLSTNRGLFGQFTLRFTHPLALEAGDRLRLEVEHSHSAARQIAVANFALFT